MIVRKVATSDQNGVVGGLPKDLALPRIYEESWVSRLHGSRKPSCQHLEAPSVAKTISHTGRSMRRRQAIETKSPRKTYSQ